MLRERRGEGLIDGGSGVDQTFRQLCAEHGLGWVVHATDAAVTEGHAESVTEGSSSHYQRRGGPLSGYGLRPDERSRIEPEIVQRPYTDEERILLLLDAMLVVYRELPDISAETVRGLTDGFQGRAVIPDQIVTALDEGNEEDVLVWQPELPGGLQNRQRVIGALTALRRAVVLVFRGAPGVIHARRRSFTHAVLYFGAARPIEVHLRVKVQSKNFDAESDVLLIDTKAARASRDKQQLPKPAGCVLTIEGKYYPLGVPRDEALKYVGMRKSFPPSMASLFVTNTFSPHANRCLSHDRRLPFEFGAVPGTRFQTCVRGHIRESFKKWVAGFDFGQRI